MVLEFIYQENVVNRNQDIPSHLCLSKRAKTSEDRAEEDGETARSNVDGKENVPPVAPFGSPLPHVFGTHRFEKSE